MTILLSQAVPLLSKIKKHLDELYDVRNQVATITHHREATPEEIAEFMPMQSVDELTQEIERVAGQLNQLRTLVAKANVENYVTFNGRELSLDEAIDYAAWLRREAQTLAVLGNTAKVRIGNSFIDSRQNVVVRTTYEPQVYKQKAIELQKQADTLSMMIDMKNTQVTLDFDASEYLG